MEEIMVVLGVIVVLFFIFLIFVALDDAKDTAALKKLVDGDE